MYTMKASVAVAKEADAKKGISPTRSDKSIHRVRNEPERQLGSLRDVIGNIRRDGGMPSADSIATELSGMHSALRAPVLLALQQTHGNRYVQRVVAGIQAKLKVGQPGDVYEQEADRVADAVMRMPEPGVQRQIEEEEEEELIQTKPLAERIMPSVQGWVEEEEELQAKELSGRTSEISPNLEARINTIRGGGQPLPASIRTFFEPRFGYDFSQVRIHTGAQAADATSAVNAQAFTSGRDIVFGVGQYTPQTIDGKRLLAHELTHVLQQIGGSLQGKLTTNRDTHNRRVDKAPMMMMGKHKGNIKDEGSTPFIKINSRLLMDASIIQRRQRRVFFELGRPQETESIAPRRLTEYLSSLTSLGHLVETRGIAEGNNVRITGRASIEAPSDLSDPDKMEFNTMLSTRRAHVVANYLQHSDDPPLITGWEYAGDRGADENPVWQRVEVDIEEDERDTTEQIDETDEEVWDINTIIHPTGTMTYGVDTDWGYGQMSIFDDDSEVSFSATANIERTSTGFANLSFSLEVTDLRDEPDNDTHISTFGGNIGMRVQDGNLVLDDDMVIQSQNVSIAGDLDVRVGYRPVGNNRYQLLVHVIYVNKKQQPDGGGGLSVSVLGSGGGITAPSGIRGGGSVGQTFVCGTLTIDEGLYE